MSEMIEIGKIIVKSNPRKDFGNIDELVKSIKEQGILNPLLVTKDYELISGERRLRSAQILKMDTVPIDIVNTDETTVEEIKLVENIQRKNLNVIEEGEAFDTYLHQTAYNEEYLAKKIGKSVDYIKRRIALKSLNKKSRDALISKKIQLGHAVVLSRLESKKQTEVLQDIITYNTNVSEISDSISSDYFIELDTAPFDKTKGIDGDGNGKTGCKHCKYNGSEQTFLIDAGEAMKGNCMKVNCFLKKVSEWVKKEKAALEKKGITVIDQEKVKAIKGAYAIHNYNQSEYKKAVANLEKKPEIYAVVFFQNAYSKIPEKQIWQIKEEKKSGKKEDVQEEAAEKLNLSREEKLKTKIILWRRDWLIKTAEQLLKPGHIAKAVMMHLLVTKYDHWLHSEDYKKIFALNEDELEKRMTEYAKQIYYEMDEENLMIAAVQTGVNATEHYELTDAYLDLYQKSQLEDLAKEWKISLEGLTKNGEIKEAIKKGWKKGMVPKLLMKM